MKIKKKSLKIVLGINALLLSTISLAAPPPLWINFYKPNYPGDPNPFVGVPAYRSGSFYTPCPGGSAAIWTAANYPMQSTATPLYPGSPHYGFEPSVQVTWANLSFNACIGGASPSAISSANPANATMSSGSDGVLTYQVGAAFSFQFMGFTQGTSFTFDNNVYYFRLCKQSSEASAISCCFDTDNSSCSGS